MSNHKDPKLSVIIASYNARETMAQCIDSLRRQPRDLIFETIVVDSSTDGTAELVNGRFPDVRLVSFSQRRYPGSARNAGIEGARGDIVAFVDADCTVDSNWAREVVQAHRAPALAIGGAIANGNPRSYVGWAAYFCEFSQWIPGTRPHRSTDIAAANMSYKREAFTDYGRFLEGGYCSDTDFHWRLVRSGHPLQFVPSIVVYHHNIDRFLRFLSHEYQHGRWFGKMRVKSEGFSGSRRIRHALAFPLFAFTLFLATAARALRHGTYALPFLKAAPLVALGHAAWCWGECVGCIRK